MDYRVPTFFAILLLGFVAASILYNFIYIPTPRKVMRATILAPIGTVGSNEVHLMEEFVRNGTLVRSTSADETRAQIGGALIGGITWKQCCNTCSGTDCSYCASRCPGMVSSLPSSSSGTLLINNGACNKQSDCASDPGASCVMSITGTSHSLGYCELPESSGTGNANVQTSYGYSCAEACTAYSWSGTIAHENDVYGCWAANGWASPEGCCCGPHSTFIPTAGFGPGGTFATQADLEKAQGGPFKGLPPETIAWYFSPDNQAGSQGASWNHELLCGIDSGAYCTRECDNAGQQSPGAVMPGGESCWEWCKPSAGFEHISAACKMWDNCNCPPDTPGYNGHYTPPGGNGGTITTTTTTSSTTTTTQVAGTFDAGIVSCTEIQNNVFRCKISYTNNLGAEATVIFEYSDSSGNIVSSPEAIVSTGSGTASSQFHCSTYGSGTYTVSWIAYKGTDFSNSVDSSKTSEIATVTC